MKRFAITGVCMLVLCGGVTPLRAEVAKTMNSCEVGSCVDGPPVQIAQTTFTGEWVGFAYPEMVLVRIRIDNVRKRVLLAFSSWRDGKLETSFYRLGELRVVGGHFFATDQAGSVAVEGDARISTGSGFGRAGVKIDGRQKCEVELHYLRKENWARKVVDVFNSARKGATRSY